MDATYNCPPAMAMAFVKLDPSATIFAMVTGI
jgi:hypothetical protein